MPQAILYNRKFFLALFRLPVQLPTIILCMYFLFVCLQQVIFLCGYPAGLTTRRKQEEVSGKKKITKKRPLKKGRGSGNRETNTKCTFYKEDWWHRERNGRPIYTEKGREALTSSLCLEQSSCPMTHFNFGNILTLPETWRRLHLSVELLDYKTHTHSLSLVRHFSWRL